METFILGIFVFLSIPFTMWVATPEVAIILAVSIAWVVFIFRSKTIDDFLRSIFYKDKQSTIKHAARYILEDKRPLSLVVKQRRKELP